MSESKGMPRRPAVHKSAPVSDEEKQLLQAAVSEAGLGGFAKFGDIPAHRFGRALRGRLYRLANSLPEEERLNLAQRIKTAATTVTASLATGFGEGTFRAGVIRALESRGALFGLQDHIDHLHEQSLLDEKAASELREEVNSVVVAVNDYLGILARTRNKDQE